MTVAWLQPMTDESCLSLLVTMEMSSSSSSSSSRSREAVRERISNQASVGVCRRKEEAESGTHRADMDLHCDCAAETPAAEQPSGKINKTAFKLFKKRKSGGTMPSIFGVKNKGDGKSSSKTGMVRSKTHDGLAEVLMLESSKKEEPNSGGGSAGGGSGDRLNADTHPRAAVTSVSSLANSSVAKSHSFFSLLRKNGRSENGKGEHADQNKAGSKQKKGLKGIFSSMRWHKKDKHGKEEEKEEPSEIQSSLILPGSLTASLECIKEEIPKPLCEPENPTKEIRKEPSCEFRGGEEVNASVDKPEVRNSGESLSPVLHNNKNTQREDATGHRHEERHRESREPGTGEIRTAQDTARTGCGDIIADQEDEAGASCDKNASGTSKPAPSKKNPNMVAYQGGGEEMASPDEVDDTHLQEFWDMLSQTEDQEAQEPQGVTAKAAAGAAAKETKVAPESSKDGKGKEGARDASLVKRSRIHRIPIELHHKEDLKHREKEQQEGIPNSDEGYWDSTTPGPEEDSTSTIQKEGIPRDSYSGDALYDLYTDPEENPAGLPSDEEVSGLSRSKPVSPITITCPLKTPGSLLKDSKIPISIKHLASLPASHPVVHHHPTKSEIPRTKIPVSKVLVRRVSNRGLAGTTIRAAACHDGAKKL
ncbi:APC membrane recruitment protein 2 isoform X1 [Monodelphis domestica]|uniref:APC membrane recruitment protein 2 isoform X1 n=1 Tax=Monodelphis domestica TaxID=13616 RepID=UPI0024E25C66|nr:APC membrane recruitment protein 2 isoform X1 [Monodelphis domestica]